MESPRNPDDLTAHPAPHPITVLSPGKRDSESESDRRVDSESDGQDLDDRFADVELGQAGPASLEQIYINMLHEHPKELKQAITRIHAAMKEKRAQKVPFRGYGGQVDHVTAISQQIEDHFGDFDKTHGGAGAMPMRAFGRNARKKSTALQARKDHLSHLIQGKVTSVLQDHDVDADDLAAAHDTAQILGSFVATQSRNGIKPNPKDLIGFLAQVDFISAAPAAAECCGRMWGCKPATVRRVTIVFWIVAIIFTLALQGASIASNYLTVTPSGSDGESTIPPANTSASSHLELFGSLD